MESAQSVGFETILAILKSPWAAEFKKSHFVWGIHQDVLHLQVTVRDILFVDSPYNLEEPPEDNVDVPLLQFRRFEKFFESHSFKNFRPQNQLIFRDDNKFQIQDSLHLSEADQAPDF